MIAILGLLLLLLYGSADVLMTFPALTVVL